MGTDFTAVQATGIGMDTATGQAMGIGRPFMRTSDTRLRSTTADTTVEAFAVKVR
jgi:hypothetical protein